MASTDEVSDPLSRSIFGLKAYKTAQEAFSEDVVPRATGAAAQDPLKRSLWAPKSSLFQAPEVVDDPAPASNNSGDFARGLGIAGKQLKQTAYGTAALIGDTVGADSVKQWGLRGYKEAEKEIQAVSKPSDSFTTALDMGGGAVVDWLQYAGGYLTGQAIELGAASIAGALVGGAAAGPAAPAGAAAGAVTGAVNKAAVQTGIRGAVSKMIDKEAALLTSKYIAERGMTKEVAEKAAAEAAMKSVYRSIGATTANTFLNATQSLGSIYGEAVEEAAKNGEEYSLGKIWLSGIAATAVDTWADSRAVKGLTDAFKGRNRASSIAVEAFKGGLREGLTEGTQTVIERWGANKDLATKEAFKEYIDSAAIGVLGGTTVGGVSGAVAKIQTPGEQASTEPNITRFQTGEERLKTPVDFDGRQMQMREDVEATLNRPDLMAALYMRGDETQRETIRRAIERAGLMNEFSAALQNPKALEAQNQIVNEYPDLLPNMVSGLDIFANTLPDRTFKFDFRTTGGTLADEQRQQEEEEAEAAASAAADVGEPNDPSVVPKSELPARTGPQGDSRNAVIAEFNEEGTRIFKMNPGQVQDAKFTWAVNKLVKTHGFSVADAKAILTGELTPSQEQDANESAADEVPADPPPQTPPNLDDQGALDEALDAVDEQQTAAPVDIPVADPGSLTPRNALTALKKLVDAVVVDGEVKRNGWIGGAMSPEIIKIADIVKILDEYKKFEQFRIDSKPGDLTPKQQGFLNVLLDRLRDAIGPAAYSERIEAAMRQMVTPQESGGAPAVFGKKAAAVPEATKPATPPKTETQQTASSRKLTHFTLPERAASLRKSGKYTFDNNPVHGTGGNEDGPRTGRMAGKRIYLSLDDGVWSTQKVFKPTGEKRLSTGKDDHSRGKVTFDYKLQKWMYQPGEWSDISLEGVEVEVSPSARVLVIDSKETLSDAVSRFGPWGEGGSLWDRAALEYDAIEVVVSEELKKTSKFFGSASGSQLVVLNPAVAKISQTDTKPATPPKTESQKATEDLKDAAEETGGLRKEDLADEPKFGDGAGSDWTSRDEERGGSQEISERSTPPKTESQQVARQARIKSFDDLAPIVAGRAGVEVGGVQRIKNPAFLNKIAKAFNADLYTYRVDKGGSGATGPVGTFYRNQGGRAVIAINIGRAEDSSLFVLGHEVFHLLEAEFPRQASELRSRVIKYIKSERVKAYKDQLDSLNDGTKSEREVVADVMGQMFTDKKFWDQVASENPTLVQKILEVIDRLIARFRANMDRQQVAQFISDYDKVRDELASFVAKYGGKEGERRTSDSKESGVDAVDQMADLSMDARAAQGAATKPLLSDPNAPLFSKSSDGVIKAVFIPEARTIFYSKAARALNPDQLYALYLHEAGAHYGFVRMVGNERYKAILQELEGLRSKDALIAKAFDSVPADTRPELVSSEALGYLVENHQNLGIVQKFLQAIRDWYAKTFKGQTLTSTQLTKMAKAALSQYGHEVRKVQLNEDFSATPEPGLKKVDFQAALNGNKQAHEFMDFMSGFGSKVILTGSLAISPQADIYRPPGEQVHDLDFMVSDMEAAQEILASIRDRFPNSSLARTFTSKRAAAETIQLVVDSTDRSPLHIDLFVPIPGKGAERPAFQHAYTGVDGQQRTIGLKDYRDTFAAKFTFGRAKDVNDALRSEKFLTLFSKESASGPESDTQDLDRVKTLIRAGKVSEAAKLFRQGKLFERGFGNFNDIVKAANATTEKTDAKPAASPQKVIRAEERPGFVGPREKEESRSTGDYRRNISAEDDDNVTFQRDESEQAGQSQKRANPPTSQPEQARLRLRSNQERRQEAGLVTQMLRAIEGKIREMTKASLFEDSIRQIQTKIAEIDSQLKKLGNLTTDDGERFRARNEEDENPNLWGQQDENAYDRFSGGMVFDKATPKNALLDMRRKLADDLQKAREGSLRGQARLYRIGMDRLFDYVIQRAESAIRGGVDPEVVRAAVRPYLDGINALREDNARPQEEEASVDPALEEANRNLAQQDFFEGQRVAAGILADFKNKRITKRELEELEQRGMRDGDFTMGELLDAYRAMGISPEQRLYAGLKHFSTRVRLKDYVAQQGGSVSAVDAWFLDMQQARRILGEERFYQIYPLNERRLLDFWQQDRSEILGRRRVTQAMRESDNPRIAFKGFLFTRITLEEARNPDTIRNTTLRQTLTGLFDNLEEAWFQDVAVALRRRPSLANGIFDYRVGNNIASAIMEGVLSPQEQQAFRQWVERMKAGAQKEAEVLARVPYFEAIRNDGSLLAVRTPEGAPMVASIPQYDEVVTLTAPAEEVSPQSLMDEATQAIESFASAQRIKTTDIQKVEGADRSPSGRGFSRYTFVLKDGRRLVGEQLQLFPGGPLSSEGGYGIAVPEVMNAALKNDLQTVYRLFEKSDPRTQARTRSQTFYLSAEPDLFLERSAGRPDTTPSQYERLYTQIVNGELEAVQALMDTANRLKAIRQGRVDEDGVLLVDELAADALDSILMNAQMGSSFDRYGNEMAQYGASIKGDKRVVRTVEEAAARDAQIGGNQNNALLEDLSVEDQFSEGVSQDVLIAQTQNMGKSSMGKLDRQEQGFDDESDEDSESDQDLDDESNENSESDQGLGPVAEQKEEGSRTKSRLPMSLEGGLEYRFRRGPAWDAVTGAFVQDAVNRLTAGWKNATNVVVLPNAQHLPEPLRSRVIEKLAGSGAKGLYHEGTVYLFSQHLTGDADIEFTLFHEAYGHLGMRAVLGDKFDQFLETAYRTRADVKNAVDALVADGMPKLEAIDEVLSDMAAENRNVSVVKQWVGKIISGLREIGFNQVADWLGSMTDAEVASTLKAARDAARNGLRPAWNGAPAEIRFSKTARMPYEIFANKAGKTTGYARYNPSTDTWVVFTATGADIKDGHTAVATQDYDEVLRAMRSTGKIEYRTRSGVFVDDKIVADLVAVPKLNDQGKYGILDKRSWAKWRRNAQIQFQNEYLPVFEVVDYLASIGRLTDKIDVKTALTLYERRTGFLVEKFRKEYVEPITKLVEQAGKLGVTKKDIDRYLTARHTKERNNAVAKINPGMQDGGSGLTYKQAREIIAQVEASPAARVMSEIARKTDMMGKEKIRYLMDTGMITKAAGEKLLQYDHYVNLSGERDADPDFDDPGQIAGGSKFNVKGKEKRAFGRGAGNEAENVLARTIQAYEAALIRGQKNLVAQKVLALFETNYDPSAVIINAQPRLRQLNPETGLVEEVIDENYMARKDVMVAKINGIPSTIEFKDNTRGSFAEAIHGMVVPRTSAPIMEAVGKVTRMLGALLTTYNPAFTAVNFFRDVQTMYIQAAADGRITQKMARDMIKVLPKAIMAAVHEASGGRYGKGADDNMLRVLREMQEQGGITYFADRLNLEEQVAKIDALLSGKQYPGQKKVEMLLGILEFGANVSEIAPRLAAYKVVSDNGFSPEQAAVFSGEITVNFNMRGANREMRQLFLFLNPAVQSGYKIHQLWKSPEGRKKFYGMAVALTVFGMLTSYIGRAVSGEDDDGIDRLDKVPLYKRATSVVISADSPLGAPLPIPYGWNAFFALGVFMADTFQGKQPLSVTATRVVKTAAEAFSPIGMGAMDAKSTETFLAKFVAPTILLPGVEFAFNENRFGAPILKGQSQFDPAQMPDAQKYFRGVSPISRGITETLTELTYGNKYKAGKIDVSPATIDFLIQSYLPGLPSDLYKGASVGIRAAQGEEIKRAPWPLLDRFSARIPTGYDAGAYRRAAELVETVYKEYSNIKDQGRRAEIRQEYPRLGYAHAAIASTKQELRDIRQQIAELEERKMSDGARVERRNQLLEREEKIFKRAVKRLMQAGEPVREAMLANE